METTTPIITNESLDDAINRTCACILQGHNWVMLDRSHYVHLSNGRMRLVDDNNVLIRDVSAPCRGDAVNSIRRFLADFYA